MHCGSLTWFVPVYQSLESDNTSLFTKQNRRVGFLVTSWQLGTHYSHSLFPTPP